MRSYADLLDLRPSLIGTIYVSKTAIGAPVDTIGFSDVLAVLIVGACFGTGGNAGVLSVKFQECATMTGTGALWSDITPGAVNATFSMADISIADATSPIMYMGTKYEHIGASDANRKRYIRAHATMTGTDACNPKFSVGFLLGRAVNSDYIAKAVQMGTGNSQFTLNR